VDFSPGVVDRGICVAPTRLRITGNRNSRLQVVSDDCSARSRRLNFPLSAGQPPRATVATGFVPSGPETGHRPSPGDFWEDARVSRHLRRNQGPCSARTYRDFLSKAFSRISFSVRSATRAGEVTTFLGLPNPVPDINISPEGFTRRRSTLDSDPCLPPNPSPRSAKGIRISRNASSDNASARSGRWLGLTRPGGSWAATGAFAGRLDR
jgi:hypothetical protein